MTVKQITAGQDSFLDIVANLVGVLIILVVVVGAQAKVAWQPAEPTSDLSAEILDVQTQLESTAIHATKLELDSQQLEEQIKEQVVVNLQLGDLRHQMLVQIQMVEQQLARQKLERRQKLSAQQQAELDRRTEQRMLEQQLAEKNVAFNAVAAASQPKSEVIEHFPNPIAKTVFAEEIHFQLRGGKLAYVPLDELVNRMKSEWKVKAEKLQQSSHIVETVGPIQNFRLQYELAAAVMQQSSPQGVVERTAIRFEGFSIFPSSDALGSTVDEALGDNSEFQSVLRRYPPGKTTVSLWIYPDSYTQYNQLKNWLYENGYQIACWPLDADKRIAGGPNGFRTSAQ